MNIHVLLWFAAVLSTQLTMAEAAMREKQRIKSIEGLHGNLQQTEETLKKSEQAPKELRVTLQEMMDNLNKDEMKWKNLIDSRFKAKKVALQDVSKGSQRKPRSTEQQNVITREHIQLISSCRQAPNMSGKYMIQIRENIEPFEVVCEQTKFGGGWTVIQHRFNGSVNFYRNWTEYRNGFGTLDGEFWLGLEHVYQMSKNQPHELLIEMEDYEGNYVYAKYRELDIGSETEMYELKKFGKYSGTAGDSMWYNKGSKFSTFDRDNDDWEDNCAEEHHGAWWYDSCTRANLNGRYINTKTDQSAMIWNHYGFKKRYLSYSRMMIRDMID